MSTGSMRRADVTLTRDFNMRTLLLAGFQPPRMIAAPAYCARMTGACLFSKQAMHGR
jgi:hypothetical protein